MIGADVCMDQFKIAFTTHVYVHIYANITLQFLQPYLLFRFQIASFASVAKQYFII